MAKKRRKRAVRKTPVPALLPRPVIVNPFGEPSQRQIRRQQVKTSRYVLSDKTVLLVTPKVSDIRRALKQYSASGQPLYFLTLGYEIKTKAPKKLVKKMPKQK